MKRPPTSIQTAFIRFSALCNAAVIAIALIVLTGWRFDVSVMRSMLPGWISMNPMSALCFLLCSVWLWILRREDLFLRFESLQKTLAFSVVSVSAVKLLHYCGIAEIPVDKILFSQKLGANIMAPNSALAFLM